MGGLKFLDKERDGKIGEEGRGGGVTAENPQNIVHRVSLLAYD